MVLLISRPFQHPKTGVFWIRKRVPTDLVATLGKVEERYSLKTRDPAEAKKRHAEEVLKLEAQWANLRAGPRSLTEREAHELASIAHDRWLEMHRDNPSQQAFWRTDLGETLWSPPPVRNPNGSAPEDLWVRIDADTFKRDELKNWCVLHADQLLATEGLVVDEGSRLTLAKAIAAAVQRASLTLARLG